MLSSEEGQGDLPSLVNDTSASTPQRLNALSRSNRGSAARSSGGRSASDRSRVEMKGEIGEREEEWSRCSREMLVEMLQRFHEEKEEVLGRIEELQGVNHELLREKGLLQSDFTQAKTSVERLMMDESRM
jgi:hypothetical protein